MLSQPSSPAVAGPGTHHSEVCLLELPSSLLQALGDHCQLRILPLQVLHLLLCLGEAAPALESRRRSWRLSLCSGANIPAST